MVTENPKSKTDETDDDSAKSPEDEKVPDSEADIDEKIRARKEQDLKAREEKLEKGEVRLKEQRAEVSKMADEVERSGKGFAPKEPKQDSPEEYAEKVMKGEANPFKDDKIE